MNALDEALANLADKHRRRILLDLLDHNPQAVGGLSLTDDVSAEDSEVEDLQVQMYHVHLPKLDDAGFIEWKKDDLQVVKGPKFDEIKPLLELLADNADELPDGELQ